MNAPRERSAGEPGAAAGGDRPSPWFPWTWVPVAILLVTTFVLWTREPATPHESAFLTLALNATFGTTGGLLVAYLFARGYLGGGSPGLLLFACGTLVWSLASVLGFAFGGSDLNANVTIHNVNAALSGLLQCAGALVAVRRRRAATRPDLALAVGSAIAIALVALIVTAVRTHALPTFFVQGLGGTRERQFLLAVTIGLFGVASAVIATAPGGRRSAFSTWYAPALAGIAVGLLGITLQSSVGSSVGWCGRTAQLVGSVYLLVAAVAATRDSRAFSISVHASLRESEGRFRSLLELAPDPIVVHQDGRFVYANGAAARLYGARERDELLGRTVLEHVAWEDHELVRQRIESVAAGRTTPPRRVTLLRLDDDVVTVEASAAPIDYDGRPATLTILRDVTERDEAERATLREQRLRESVMQATDVMLVYLDPDFNFVWVNPAYAASCRKQPEELVGRNHFELYPNDENEAIFRRVRDTGAAVFYKDKPFTFPDQPEREVTYWDWSLVPVLETGHVAGLVFSLRETTKYKRAELALAESEARLREAIDKLVEEDRRKSEFLAVLSHELRNPLAPIRNSLYVLERAAPGGDQAQRAQAVIERQVAQLARLVDDLLDVTRISRNKIQLKHERLALDEVVRRTVEDHRTMLEAAGLRVSVTCEVPAVFVDADRSRLAQMVGNLLHNAAKFTPAGGTVAIAVEVDGTSGPACAVVRVKDTGVGMGPDILARLFQPFAQADASLARGKGGLGLGLALVKSLAELHGGSIEGKSDGPLRGSEFVLRLPLAEASPAVPAPPAATRRVSPRRVLVIEDNVDAAQSLRDVLELAGHEVAVAHDGPAGLALARTFRPDVVFCDIGLPGMNGFDVARALRASEDLAQLHLVAISGYALPADLEEAAQAGFERHIPKPPRPEQLHAVIEELAAERR